MLVKWFVLVLISVVFPKLSSSFPRHAEKSHSTIAESESVLDPKGDIRLKWRVDYVSRTIRFRIILSESVPRFSWFAIGFSDRGEFDNADVCLLWTDYNGEDHFEDMSSDSASKLHRDRHQDCEGLVLDAETRCISFQRAWDTCDDADYVIEDGTTHIIWARGTDKLFSSQGICLTCTTTKDRGFIRVRLLTPPPLPQPKGRSLKVVNKNVRVPSSDTTYWCKVQKLPDDITKKMHHIIQFKSSITPGNEGLVHHMEVFYCDAKRDQDIPLYEGNCFAKERPEITKICSKVKAAWAMGALPFTYPEEAGLPLGGPSAGKYVMLEVHYNNLEKKADWIDSSGIEMIVTSQIRKYNAAIMELGLEYTDKMAIPAGQHGFPLSGHCVPQCTGVGIPSTGITVFGSQLHTHLTGTAVWTRHVRDGRELPLLNADSHYSTHFQEIRILNTPVQVKPGDYLETTCIYRTLNTSTAVVGGHAITDEMCVNYIHYYPAIQLEVCKSAVANLALENYFKFEHNWDNISISSKHSPRENYLAIHPWTPLRTQTLMKLYAESPISMQCNKSDGNRFQGEWEGLAIPSIRVPLQPEPRQCPKNHIKLNN